MPSDARHSRAWIDDGRQSIGSDAITDLLDATFQQGPGETATHQALIKAKKRLSKEGAEVLYYDILPSTPFGPIYVAVSDTGIAALGFDRSEAKFVARVQERYRSRVERSPSRLERVVLQLKEYLTSERDTFDLELDLRFLTPFQRMVLDAIQDVPPGETISYGGLAHRIGKPKAARAVGQALGSNPIPIIIPCHRALASDGSLGGYSGRGGVRTKQALLELEGAWK